MDRLITPAFTAALFLYQTSRVGAYLPGLHLRLRQNNEYRHHNVQLLQQRPILPQPRSKKLPRTSLLVLLPTRRFPTCSGKLTIELVGSTLMATPRGGQQDEGDGSQGAHERAASDSTGAKGIYGLDREIVEREAAEAPFRRFRLIAYGFVALAAVVLGGVSVAGLAGVEEFSDLGRNLPNPLLDAAVLCLALYLWIEEVKTKRSALRLMEKRVEEESRVPNRAARRLNKRSGSEKRQRKRSIETEATTTPPASLSRERLSSAGGGESSGGASSEPQTPSATSNSDDDDRGAGGGMFEGVVKTLEAVNRQSYYQALALNKKLEDKGVLPRLEREPGLPGDRAQVAVDPESRRDPPDLVVDMEESLEGRAGVLDIEEDPKGGQKAAPGRGETVRREKNKSAAKRKGRHRKR